MATVLVIDDAPDVHTLLAARLRPEAVNLISALSWEDGRRLAVGNAPDLILLDVDLPDLSGLELCKILKEDPATSAIPIIFLTGSTDVNVKVHGFDLGAVDYVTKPFHPAELRARVRAALRTKRLQDLLTARAQVDALTGLQNRGAFDQFLRSSLGAAMADAQPCSLVLLDIDHFKGLNDRFGHPFGDAVLQRVGEIVAAAARPGEVAFRYGGEEMALVLPGSTSEMALARAEDLRKALARLELRPRSEPVRVTASFGVAEVRELAALGREPSSAMIVSAADGALYDAKKAGRDRVCSARIRGASMRVAA